MYVNEAEECRCSTHSHRDGKSGFAVAVERDKLTVEDRFHGKLREEADVRGHLPAAPAAHP